MSLLSLTKKILQKEKKKPAEQEKKESDKNKEPKTDTVSVKAGIIGLNLMLTEKSMKQQGKGNIVVFMVRPEVTKSQIAAAVQEKYKVKALAVRTVQYKPKNRRRGNIYGHTKHWKKAYVTVNDLSAINTAP